MDTGKHLGRGFLDKRRSGRELSYIRATTRAHERHSTDRIGRYIRQYTPLALLYGWWNSLPGFLTRPLAEAQRRRLEFILSLGDRKIPLIGAEIYNYKRPFD